MGEVVDLLVRVLVNVTSFIENHNNIRVPNICRFRGL